MTLSHEIRSYKLTKYVHLPIKKMKNLKLNPLFLQNLYITFVYAYSMTFM
jgi:hypothetical protein